MRRSFILLAVSAWMAFGAVACSSSDSGSESPVDTSDTGAAADTSTGADTATGNDTASGDDTASADDTATADDTAVADTGADDAAGDVTEDGGGTFDCTGVADGTDCGGGSICLAGACVGSSCGDGFVDTKTGEECDDSNAVSGDGCSSCKFDCKTDPDCDNGFLCDGAETCDTAKHTCKAGTAAADSTACTMTAGGAGVCSGGVCVKAGCGNKTVEAGEDCDDGNADDTDGCTTLCKFTCKANADCDDGDKCNGTETCDTATHKCKAGTAVSCSPKAGCTGTCDSATGACSYPDADKDGVACDKDCNDADPAMFPGAFECKDGKDNDCNPATADGTAPGCECYADPDKDGFALKSASVISSAGACPDGYTRRKPVDAATTDCRENNPSVYPTQSGWFTSAYCTLYAIGGGGKPTCVSSSYDYDCSGTETKQDATIASSTCIGGTFYTCKGRSGWIGAVPACGAKGTYRTCTWTKSGCVGSDAANVTQGCH